MSTGPSIGIGDILSVRNLFMIMVTVTVTVFSLRAGSGSFTQMLRYVPVATNAHGQKADIPQI